MNKEYGIRRNLFDEMLKLFKDFGLRRVMLFGSRARGDYRNNSDIDLAVIFNSKDNDNYIRLFTKLEELNTLYKFDVIDFNRITNDKLKEEILKDGICIYIN